MKPHRLSLFLSGLLAFLPLAARTLPPERLDPEVRAKVEKYVAARDSLVGVLKGYELQYERGDSDADLMGNMNRKLDKIAELEAVIDYLTLDTEGSTGKEICIVARKLINTLRPGLACQLLASPAAMADPFAPNYIGVNRYGKDDFAGAMEMFIKAADMGYLPAIFNVAAAIHEHPEIFAGAEMEEMKKKMARAYTTHPDVLDSNPPRYLPPYPMAEYIPLDQWGGRVIPTMIDPFIRKTILAPSD